MKNTTSGIALSIALIAAACNQPAKTETTITPKSWDYVITAQTTKNNLDSLVTTWKKDSIDLQFSKMDFDGSGKLSVIAGTVDIYSMGHHVNGRFTQDSLAQKPFEIKLDNRPGVYIGLKKWDYVITAQTNKNSLDSLIANWKKDSIDLQFSKIDFDKSGKLSVIAGTVDIFSMGHHINGSFTQDSLAQKPFEIKLDKRPGMYIGLKK